MNVKFLAVLYLVFLYSPFLLEASSSRQGVDTNSKTHIDTLRFPVNISPVHETKDFLKNIDLTYGIVFYKNGILFMSNSKQTLPVLSDYVNFGRLDTYFAPLKDFKTGPPEYFLKGESFPFPPGGISFSRDYKTLYFTKSSISPKGKERYTIYKTDWNPVSYRWSTNFQALPFCSSEYSYMHPAVGMKGKLLIFSSDILSQQGNFNLFKSFKNDTGWSVPVSLGTKINSNANELFPFLDSLNNLYFSSNRSDTTGYDIYFSRYNGKGWETPIALGTEVNTISDELMFKIDQDNSLALVVTTTDSGPPKLHFYTLGFKAITMANKPSSSSPDRAIKPDQAIKEKNIKQKPKAVALRKESQSKPSGIASQQASRVTSHPINTSVSKGVQGIVFRIQIVSLMKPKKDFTVSVNNKKYLTWHYYYKGAYRYTIGSFKDVGSAVKFKNICAKHGFPQAFVAAFKGRERITDPKVFKH